MESISAMNNVTMTLKQFEIAHTQLSLYLEKYEKRLLAKNCRIIRDIAQLCKAFAGYLKDN